MARNRDSNGTVVLDTPQIYRHGKSIGESQRDIAADRPDLVKINSFRPGIRNFRQTTKIAESQLDRK